MEPALIGEKLLKPGNKVISPFRQIHFDTAVFGNNVDNFDPDRFLRKTDLANHPSFKPFGGGMTVCPNRFVARQEVYIFVALMLHRFESGLTNGDQPMPRFELHEPTTGVASPRVGDDVYVTLRDKGYEAEQFDH